MIIWDEDKNTRLKLERNIGFEEIADLILSNDVVAIIDHPKRKNQDIFVVEIDDYIYAVPFVIDENEDIILKTIFPSRKLNKKYKGAQ